MIQKIDVVTRSFQAGTGDSGKDFDMNKFSEKVARPIANLLRFTEVVNRIIVVTNGTVGNKLAEIVDIDGTTPSVKAFGKAFPNEISSGKIVVLVCEKWGNNPGSGAALNQGIGIAEGKWVMCWSPEMAMDGYKIAAALNLAEEKDLAVVGFYRKRWWQKTQWNVAQNTACIWNREMLLDIGGFSYACNGNGEKVSTVEFGDVPRAGMEDYHAMCRLMLRHGSAFRWGLVGRNDPLAWAVDFPEGERRENHLKKVARQGLVMEAYTRDIFPDENADAVMDRFFMSRYEY